MKAGERPTNIICVGCKYFYIMNDEYSRAFMHHREVCNKERHIFCVDNIWLLQLSIYTLS